MMDPRRQRLIQRRGWDRAAPSYEEFWQRQLRPAQDRLLAMADLHPGDRVIDIACGTGLVTIAAATAVGPTGRVTATDLSPRMVVSTQEAAEAAGRSEVEVVCCDAEDLAADGPYDVALCSLGLMYVPDPGRALAEMHRVLRPGGRVVVSVWGDRSRCGWADIFGIVDARVSSDVCPLFFALGTADTLAHRLRDAGFADITATRLAVPLPYRDDGEALGAAFLGGPVALPYARFDTPTRHAVHQEYLASLAPHRAPDGTYRVPGEFVIASGCRPPVGPEPT